MLIQPEHCGNMGVNSNNKNNGDSKKRQIQEKINVWDWGWKTGWLIVVLFSIIQTYMALLSPSLYQPDEIYQSYEIGHFLYYHYGIRAWEWLYHGGGIYTAPLNVGPIRSLITPLIFYILFALGDFLKLNYWTQTLPMIRFLLAMNFTLGMVALGLILREWKSPLKNVSWIIFWILIIIYPDTLLYGSHAFTNTIGLTPLWWGLLLFLWSKKSTKKQNVLLLNLLAGFLVATALWFRPDFALLIILFVFFFFPYSKIDIIFKQHITAFASQKKHKALVTSNEIPIKLKSSLYTYCYNFITNTAVLILLGFFIGGFLSFLIDGTLDFIYWGQFAASLIGYVQFNSNPSNSAIFGNEPIGWYSYTLFFKRPTFSWLLLIDVAVLVIISIKFISDSFWKKKESKEVKQLFIQLWLLSIIIISVLLIWELIPHKELRFILYWEYFFFAFSAYCLSVIIWAIPRIYINFNRDLEKIFENRKQLQKGFIVILLILFTMPFFLGILVDASNVSWHNFDDVLAAEEYIGQQSNLTGLIIIGPFWYDGGYTYLHRNVPILHIDDPGFNSSLNNALEFPLMYNYLLVPHYKYLYFPFLAQNLKEHNWNLIKTILGRSDVWLYA